MQLHPPNTNHNQTSPNQANSLETSPLVKVPEILAPAGGMAQFFAALNSGADAVFLGLKTFNARARAENFSTDDLKTIVPIAHHYGMKVLVTLNILIKDIELEALIDTLASVEDVGVDAIIVQDLGVASIAKKYFPNLRLHASTQLAVHNFAGVEQAIEWGFKRVVLARELTAQEIKRIKQASKEISSDNGVELEVFCHGSLCYSYSGLCFFSGAADARSGNRGECAYTCREPYKVTSEPGHGFLFSMKDLDTSQKLNLMVEAGVDTLKIEGRKKDAHYVSSVVRLYRKKLDDLFGRSTLRDSAPQGARDLLASPENSEAAIRRDLSLSFQRQTTSFFFENRYHENVIDLSSPTHLGLKVGSVESIQNGTVHVRLVDSLEVHDGVRVISSKKIFHAKPQDGESIQSSNELLDDRYENKESAFAIRNLSFKGRTIYEAQSGMLVEIPVSDFAKTPNVGDLLYKTRSAELKRKVEKLAKPPLDARLRPMRAVDLRLSLRVLDDGLLKLTGHITRFNESIALASVQTNNQGLRQKGQLTDDLKDVLILYGDEGVYVEELTTEGVDNYFIPKSVIKELKKSLQEDLSVKLDRQVEQRTLKAKTELLSVEVPRSIEAISKYAIKIDRLDYLPWLKEFLEGSKSSIKEIVFEPKKAYINSLDAATFIEPLLEFANSTETSLRIALPTVIRAWDEPVLKKWIQAIDQAGIRRFEIGNPGALKLLSNFGVDVRALDLSTDFTMYSLNREAVQFWQTNGINSISLSIEDDLEDLSSLLKHWPKDVTPVSILYKDTPLFIAEACSLTALHNGCPTAKVCGYRSLDIENSKGEKFTVAHEGCKSIVYGKTAFSISGHRAKLEANGVKDFRLDFLTRLYTGDEFISVIKSCLSDKIVPATHSANFLGRLK